MWLKEGRQPLNPKAVAHYISNLSSLPQGNPFITMTTTDKTFFLDDFD
jgi:hypothetical protein